MRGYMDELNKKKASASLVLSKILQVYYGACLGVKTVHEKGLIHVDVRPENIFVDDDVITNATSAPLGRLSDFESCIRQGSLDCKNKCDDGTCTYGSPELAQGEQFDESTDVSLVLFSCCSVTTRIS